VGTQLWFGTAANVLCLGAGAVNPQPVQKQTYVCEFGAGQYAIQHHLPAAAGDWRPPKIYLYDLSNNSLTDMTPTNSLVGHTLGMRSAGALGDVVFLAGPALGGSGGVNFFAFSSSAKKFLGACEASAFNDIRHWAVINNVLYAGVGNTGAGGGVIRWNGTEAEPFDLTSSTCGFEVVGTLTGSAAYLTAYGPNSDNIAVSAWPSTGGGAGIYLSPAMDPATGLTSADAGNWTQIWEPSMYEPDPVTAATYAGGAIVYWNGGLYFGTMHSTSQAAALHDKIYGQPQTYQQYTAIFQSTYRAISIWEIQNADTTPAITLLYGESALPRWVPSMNAFQSKSTGWTPLYGPSGFGNLYNNYTWTGGVFQNRLFFGTEDWGYEQSEDGQPTPAPGLNEPSSGYGADLLRFDTTSAAAVAESINGLGNYLNYGIRSMNVSPDGQSFILGTANPFNIAPQGGWELRLLQLMP
jgi:hypothetical protein